MKSRLMKYLSKRRIMNILYNCICYVLSPTFMITKLRKKKIENKKDWTTQVKANNDFFFNISFLTALTIGILLPYIFSKFDVVNLIIGDFFDSVYWSIARLMYLLFFGVRSYSLFDYLINVLLRSTYWIFIYFICWFYFGARIFEILIAFLLDAIDKLNHIPSKSNLLYGERLKLAFYSYFEIIINFGFIAYIIPSRWLHGDINSFVDALYFSATTVTTLGYGDIYPISIYVKIMSIVSVLAGFSLIVVSFTIYTSLAINDISNTLRIKHRSYNMKKYKRRKKEDSL